MDRRVTQACAGGSWMATCDPSRETPRNFSKCRSTAGPTDRRSGHRPWSMSVDQTPNYSLPVAKRRLTSTDHQPNHDCAVEDCSATLVEIADELGDPPFGQPIAFGILPLASSHSGSLGGTALLRESY
uniref:Uncharacterized protein n=1 Tax=Solanum tuberosum TaxID=4113 RepID=M1DVR7_SOLTU